MEPLGVTLATSLSFLAGKDQLSQEEVAETQTNVAVQIHEERTIKWIKDFRQIHNEIPLIMHGSINQIWSVVVALQLYTPSNKAINHTVAKQEFGMLICDFFTQYLQKDKTFHKYKHAILVLYIRYIML